MRRRPPRPPLVPSTTLFRSSGRTAAGYRLYGERDFVRLPQIVTLNFMGLPLKQIKSVLARRSEEHTSELQSRQYLVCRLLLEQHNAIRDDTASTWPGGRPLS